MMETKVWIALCALLLVHCGSSDEVHTAATASSYDQESVAPEAPAAAESTTEGETISVTLEIKKVANIVPPTEAAVLENKSTSQPSLLPSPTSHTPTTPTTTTTTTTSITPTTPTTTTTTTTSITPTTPTTTSITSTTTTTTTSAAGPTHTTHTTTTVDTPTTTPQTETTHHAALPDSATPSNQPTHNATLSPTSVPTPEPSKPETTTTSIITASSIPSTSSSQEAPSSEPSTLVRGGVVTLPPPQPTSQPDVHHEASSKAHPTHPVNPPSSPSAQAKDHAENPSQLNVGDDPTMVHDAPTLDPLLAGLVSAFIITAVIITLLLFLKLRRRDNRPEFRRLQDLPMDDMMEDTPLSMYSY